MHLIIGKLHVIICLQRSKLKEGDRVTSDKYKSIKGCIGTIVRYDALDKTYLVQFDGLYYPMWFTAKELKLYQK